MKKFIIAGVAALLIVVTGFAGTKVIPTGKTGVLIRLGQVQEETLASGFHFRIPFIDSIKLVDNKQIELNYGGQVWAECSEQTPVYYEGVSLTYQISPSASAWLYSNVSKNIINDGMALISPTIVTSAIKNAAVTLDSKSVTKRSEIEPLATSELQKSLDEKYGAGRVTIVKLSISNADFEDSYNAVIAERQAAQIKKEQQEVENQTAIAKAQAEAEVARTNAEAEAAALEIKAKAEAEAVKIAAAAQAEANQKIQASLTDSVITNNYIEKWNGEMPLVQGGNSDLMLDVSGLVEDTTE